MNSSIYQHFQGSPVTKQGWVLLPIKVGLADLSWAVHEVHERPTQFHSHHGPPTTAQNWEAVKNSPHTQGILYFPGGNLQKSPSDRAGKQAAPPHSRSLPPNPHPKPILHSVKDLALAVAKGTKPFIPSQWLGWLGLRSGVTTGSPGLWKPPTRPSIFSKWGGMGVHPSCLLTQAQLGGVAPLLLSAAQGDGGPLLALALSRGQ